jgi:hypothetical protein
MYAVKAVCATTMLQKRIGAYGIPPGHLLPLGVE